MTTDPQSAAPTAAGTREAASPGAWLSPELRAMIQPYRTFATLAAAPAQARPLTLAFARPLLMLACIGVFVSYTSAGRLTLADFGWTMLFWSFLPAFHVAILHATMGLLARGPRRTLSFARAIDLYFVARAPWLLLIIGLTLALALFVTGRISFFGLFLRGPMAVVILAVTAWSGWLDHAFFRAALGLSRPRAALAVALGYVGFAMPIAGWYLFTGQLLPLFGVPVPT